MKLGFVGLGKMGAGMAGNLLKAGHEVKVYNRTREKASALEKHGAEVADSPAAAARNVDAVFTMLADDQALGQVVYGENGVLAGLSAGACHISSSTIGVAFSRKLAEQHAEAGKDYISAPVFGRPDAAENKRLIVVAAGDPKSVERFTPLFDAMGRRTFVIGGEPWHANALKLSGNFMIASMLETFSEAFTTLRKAGIDHKRFLEVIIELFGSPVYQNYGTVIAEQRFNTPGQGFGLKLGLKDVRLVCEFAESVEAPMPVATLIRNHFVSAMANGQEALDWSSLELVVARAAGLSDKR